MNQGIGHVATMTFNLLHRSKGVPGLLELQQMLEQFGLDAGNVFHSYCNRYGIALAVDWPDAAVWPFFAHHIELLRHFLNPTSIAKAYWFDRTRLFDAITTLPNLPETVAASLFDLALGMAKSERLLAQQALDKLPEKETRIIAALGDGKADARGVAAQWLGRLRFQPAQTALEQAFSKEKNDVAKAAILDALEALGQSVEKYLNRDALASEAEKFLAKGLPKDMEWFPWQSMPAVRWADSGESVPEPVLRWMIAQAVKQKTPEPNAILKKYCAMFEQRDRQQFGQFVLESWLGEDVKPIAPEQAMRKASQQAQQAHASMQSHPQYYRNSPDFGRSVEELTAVYLPAFLRQPAGSAISSKGMLAIAAACCGERAAAPVSRFLKEYFGTRAAQGKALIATLAWIEHPSAIQLMLSIGNRFRTKSFQEEATKQAEALAERKGWTLSELADRTIPDAGFDEHGLLELSYGQRHFTAKLLPDFKAELFNPDGKKIAALPEPRLDDDAELAKETKKTFSSVKKEIKNIVNMQTDRLYEALCIERQWPYDDWQNYLNRHPIVRRLIQRLVWIHAGGSITFRPLDDGTLTDADDNAVILRANDQVRIAHDTLLAAEEIGKWQRHLEDYQVTPLFQQFGKGVYRLPEDKTDTDEIKDFEGYLLEAYSLRGRALKLGYTRGAAVDGGWFMTYEKRFPNLGLLAVIEFSGNPLPEENRTVALLKLCFTALDVKDWQPAQWPLSKIPKVLLSECYNDLRLIAADGSGFDADWRQKTEY